MQEINNLIEIEDLQIGDEVIVRGIDLNYMKILRLPRKTTATYSVGNHNHAYTYWSASKCKRMNNEKLKCNRSDDKDVYFDFSHKTVWLVKR